LEKYKKVAIVTGASGGIGRAAHELCDRYSDVATASLIEVWIDDSEKRTWFLAEINQDL
jgi:DNA-binding ferritin-like protein